MKKSTAHQGEVAQAMIKKSGYKLRIIAQHLKISKATLYKKFHQSELPESFLLDLGAIIGYDFAQSFPALKKSPFYKQFNAITSSENKRMQWIVDMQSKYCVLLKAYNKLLRFLIRYMNDHEELYVMKSKIDAFIRENLEE